jgi:hypothetical protein
MKRRKFVELMGGAVGIVIAPNPLTLADQAIE